MMLHAVVTIFAIYGDINFILQFTDNARALVILRKRRLFP